MKITPDNTNLPPEVKRVKVRNDLTGAMDIVINNTDINHRSNDRVKNDAGIRSFRGLVIAGLLSFVLWPVIIATVYGGYVFIRMILEMFQG